MSSESSEGRRNRRIEQAITELEELVQRQYPAATFVVAEGDDPTGIYVWATIDTADTDRVMDLVVDRLIDLQIDERLPLYFVPTRPLERVAAEIQAQQRDHRIRTGGHAALNP